MAGKGAQNASAAGQKRTGLTVASHKALPGGNTERKMRFATRVFEPFDETLGSAELGQSRPGTEIDWPACLPDMRNLASRCENVQHFFPELGFPC
jgi:hypothetical protein